MLMPLHAFLTLFLKGPGANVERMVEMVEMIKRFSKNNEEVMDVIVHIGTNNLQRDKKR